MDDSVHSSASPRLQPPPPPPPPRGATRVPGRRRSPESTVTPYQQRVLEAMNREQDEQELFLLSFAPAQQLSSSTLLHLTWACNQPGESSKSPHTPRSLFQPQCWHPPWSKRQQTWRNLLLPSTCTVKAILLYMYLIMYSYNDFSYILKTKCMTMYSNIKLAYI